MKSAFILLWACADPVPYPGETGAGGRGGQSVEGQADPGDTGSPELPEDSGGESVEGDHAEIASTSFPDTMACGGEATGQVTVRNAGSTDWTWDDLHKLGAVDDTDPFKGGDPRIWLEEDEVVSPGAERSFEIPLVAPDSAGTYTTDWRMVRENVAWFGETATHEIEVTCGGGDDPPALDLGDVTWLHTDVSGWPEASVLSSVTFSGDQICMEYDAADDWSIYDYNGTDVVGNPWIFIWHDDQWYGATWEWLRPGQTCKSASSVAGDHIKQDPFGESSGWVPTSGETYYFMVSGLARSSFRNVEERTNVVEVVWP